ncbi:MAG: beta-mannosidase, partial [Anaerolineae bacterium]|nr:beta-mannosidase [Anaerolineae bacterium]
NGLVRQDLYQIELELDTEGQCVSRWNSHYGLRFVELDVSGEFAFGINGRKVYCRGANWIPADALYARVGRATYDTLVREARDANFNMLRIWGGGWYEREAFYEACDRYGIMVWHDFMFACSPYPDHLDSFRIEVEHEADYQTRRLRNHACIVLWCGSNENNWGFRDWWNEQTRRGATIYNHILPRVVQRNCPEIPYWNGSPYGGDEPNSNRVGDRHHWHDCMMNPDMAKRITPEEYDKCESLFVSEFGYVGACGRESTLEYLDGASFDPSGRTWQHHTNTFERDTVAAGILKHYGVDVAQVEGVALDEYLLYSGLCQGLMLQYALESMRYLEGCHGSLFWMYNDCWGEVGWTIIDYYRRRKPSWYFVRRAFAPVRLIMRQTEDGIRVVLANDTQYTVNLDLEYGYVSLDGTSEELARVSVTGDPLARTELVVFDRGTGDLRRGLWIARDVSGADVEPGVFRAVDYVQLEVVEPDLKAEVVRADDHAATVAVVAVGYAHAVQIVRPSDIWVSDDFFDLLPGESREITIG